MGETVKAITEEATGAAPGAFAFSFRKLFQDLAVYSSGNILIKSMSLISAPIFTRIFTPDEYGAWSFISAIVSLVTGILILGGEDAYTRFYFECKTDTEKKTLTSTWFLFLAAWSMLVVLSLLPFSGGITRLMFGEERYLAAFAIAFAAAPLTMLNALFSQVLRNQFRARAFSALNVATAVLTLLLAVLLALPAGLGVAGALAGAALAALLMLPLRFWLIRDLFTWRFSVPLLKELLSFGVPLVPVVAAYWLFSNADKVMLLRLASTGAVGVYAIAVSMAGVLMLIHGAIGQSWLPHALRLYESDREQARLLFGKALNFFLAGAGFIVVCFVGLAQEVLYILVAAPFQVAFAALPYLALGALFFITTQVTVVGLLVKKKTVYIMFICGTMALVNVGLNYLFIPLWGIAGAGLATGLSYFLFTLTYAAVSGRTWQFVYYWGTTLKLLGTVVAAVILIALIAGHPAGLWPSLGAKLAVIFLAGAVLLLIVMRAENMDLPGFWRKIRGGLMNR